MPASVLADMGLQAEPLITDSIPFIVFSEHH